LHATDVVDEGAAVDGLLSAGIDVDNLTDAVVRKGYAMLAGFLPGKPREIVEARLMAWLTRALDFRYGSDRQSAWILRKRRELRERVSDLDLTEPSTSP
jgi:hypothetical protein